MSLREKEREVKIEIKLRRGWRRLGDIYRDIGNVRMLGVKFLNVF